MDNQEYEQVEQFSEATKDFEPTLTEQFVTLPDGAYQRLIFTDVDLREKEETHLRLCEFQRARKSGGEGQSSTAHVGMFGRVLRDFKSSKTSRIPRKT